MFNKIYEKLKAFIKRNKKDIIYYAVLILLFFILTFPLPFYIYSGGGTIDLKDRISLDSDEKGSYNLAYVKQINATVSTYLISFLFPKWEVESIEESKVDDSETMEDLENRDKLYLDEANSNAIINAYKLAGLDVKIKSNDYKVVYKSSDSITDVKVGDTLLTVNGISVSNNTEYKEYLNSLNVGQDLKVKVLRDGKEVDCSAKLVSIDGEKIIGLYMVNIYDYEVNPSIKLKFSNNESGPSGGFMLSLAIYDRLVSDDLTKGRKIVGTGTIDALGNVGEIGGVKYKLMGAVKAKADIFFVPEANYEEALKEKDKYDYDIELVKVSKLEDAVNYLKEHD